MKYYFEDSEPSVDQFPNVLKIIGFAVGLFPKLMSTKYPLPLLFVELSESLIWEALVGEELMGR